MSRAHPRAYVDRILLKKPGNRRSCFGRILGSKLPFRSRDVDTSTPQSHQSRPVLLFDLAVATCCRCRGQWLTLFVTPIVHVFRHPTAFVNCFSRPSGSYPKAAHLTPLPILSSSLSSVLLSSRKTQQRLLTPKCLHPPAARGRQLNLK